MAVKVPAKSESSSLAITGLDLVDQTKRGIFVQTTGGQQVELDFVDRTQYTLNRNLSIIAGQNARPAASASTTTTTVIPVIIEGTRASRLSSTPASGQKVGAAYYETDTGVLSIVELAGMAGHQVNAWVPILASPIYDTRANRATYTSFYYPNGQIYSESDTHVEYCTQPYTGTVTVGSDGVTVTSASPVFSSFMVQGVIKLSGTPYQIASYTSTTIVKLSSQATAGSVTMIIPSYQWTYDSGIASGNLSSRPTLTAEDVGLLFAADDFGVIEVALANGPGGAPEWNYQSGASNGTLATMLGMGLSGFEENWLFFETTYQHLHQWTGSAWQFAPGEKSQYVVEADQQPAGGVWYPCDGNSHTCVNGDGSTRSVPTQNWNGASVVFEAAGGFQQAANAATALTSQTVQSGSGAVAPQDIAPSVANGGLPAYFTVSKWLCA